MYTAPEVALAFERGALAALPSFAIDAFCLGLVLFEVLVSPHRAVFESDSDATAHGLRPLIPEHVFDKVPPHAMIRLMGRHVRSTLVWKFVETHMSQPGTIRFLNMPQIKH